MLLVSQLTGFNVGGLFTGLTFYNSAPSTAAGIIIPAGSPDRSIGLLFDFAQSSARWRCCRR